MEMTYTCANCGSTKTLKQGDFQAPEVFLQQLPPTLLCGVGGCTGRAVRAPVEYPIIDLRGKAIGTLVLTPETVQILQVTGVDLIMRYNVRTKEVRAWLQ